MSQTTSRRVTFVASCEHLGGLRALCVLTGASTSELVRRAVTSYLAARRHEWAGYRPSAEAFEQVEPRS